MITSILKRTLKLKEIDDLFAIVHRDIKSSEEASNLNLDWQFGIAYNAALKLCVIPIRASGVRVTGGHINSVSSLLFRRKV